MTSRIYILLFLLGVLVILPVAYVQSTPGYMDAEYYFAGSLRLVEGRGFSELILWNYLDEPSDLPHPSHGYWMPLASLVAWLGMLITSEYVFSSAKIGFLAIAGLIPPLTAALAYSITGRKSQAIMAGIIATFPVFYLAYLGTTDTFGIYMVLGALWFLIVGYVTRKDKSKNRSAIYYLVLFLALGIISGLMHLARADGILWLLVGLVFIGLLWSQKSHYHFSIKDFFLFFALFVLGYIVVMGPWMARNISVFGTPLSPGGLQVLWITEYDEIYSYPASILTFQRWLATGLEKIVRSRIHALGQNLQTLLAVQGGIFLVPLIMLGIWHLRGDLRIWLGLFAWLLTFIVMTFIFTEVGWRGGFFHSGAALQPLFWALVPVGLEVFVAWGMRIRQWDDKQPVTVFRVGIIAILIILTTFVAWNRVINSDIDNPNWMKNAYLYSHLERTLIDLGAEPDDVVMVNNAPGYYVMNGRPAISIPNGDEQVSLDVAHRFGGRYLLLEENHPQGLNELFERPVDLPGLDFLLTTERTHIFQINQN